MNNAELLKIFDNDKTSAGESCTDVFSTDKLLEIRVIMKNGHKIILFYGDNTEFIDLATTSDYIGLGSTLISPKSEIEDIIVKWR